MSLLNIIFNRASVRHYRSKPVSKEVIRNILEAGRRSPSAMNAQPWHFIVVTKKSLKNDYRNVDGRVSLKTPHSSWLGVEKKRATGQLLM